MVIFCEHGDYQVRGTDPNLLPNESSAYFAGRGALCKKLYELASRSIFARRRDFQQIVANARHYHSTLIQEMKRPGRAEEELPVNGGTHSPMLRELQGYEQQVLEWEYPNNCFSMFHEPERKFGHPFPDLFIVLPSHLASWDDNDPSTHQFRIYFLCVIWGEVGVQGGIPHSHISNHPGFGLNYPMKFFQIYGDQVLRALQMIKRGYVSRKHRVPPLKTFDILSGCKTGITGSHLSKDNFGSLVDKAISYLIDLTPPKLLNEKMDHNRSAAIRPYLDVQNGDRAEVNLFRYINHHTEVWLCRAHVQRFVDLKSLEKLTVFAGNHGGCIDLQQATLRVQLGSEEETDLFLSLLKSSKLTCDISIKMNWKVACLSLGKFCYEIATSCPVVLEIEGVTFEVHPQEPFQSIYDFFQERSAGYRTIRLVKVLNYPRPQDLSINVGHCSLQTKMTSVQSSHDWVAMGEDLLRFTSIVKMACRRRLSMRHLRAS